MPENFWEAEVYDVEPISGLERIDATEVFAWLKSTMPIVGSKIDWLSVRGEHSHRHVADGVELARAAAHEVGRRVARGSGVEHAGDNLSPCGLRFARGDIRAIVTALLEVPEHHYFLAVDRSWLVVVSFEGDLDVVDRPPAGDGV